MILVEEIVGLIRNKGSMTLDEISTEMHASENDISITLREAEILGLVYRQKNEEEEVYKA
jgi:DNA-binding transcriptional regulator GbsR (MarR family)